MSRPPSVRLLNYSKIKLFTKPQIRILQRHKVTHPELEHLIYAASQPSPRVGNCMRRSWQPHQPRFKLGHFPPGCRYSTQTLGQSNKDVTVEHRPDAVSSCVASKEGTVQSDNGSEINIIDYSVRGFVQHEMSFKSLNAFLKENKRAERACRWIHVNGLQNEAISCLGDRYGLHRLAIEDVLDADTPAKVDWYQDHCFIVTPLQTFVKLQPHGEKNVEMAQDTDKALPSHIHDQILRNQTQRRPNWRTLSQKDYGVLVEQMSIFLTTDTVITISEYSGQKVFQKILSQLKSPQTIIRSSNDPSMLVQAVMDTVVDLSLPIGKAVEKTFDALELAVLTKPSIEQSKQLYILRSGLTHLMDNTIAINSVLKMLCGHRAAPAPTESSPRSSITTPPQLYSTVNISETAQVYLSDVQDHVAALSNSTHMSIRSAENLTSLIFNTIATKQNASVRKLTLVSCFFLPLTFLTGYFGMNFESMPLVSEHSDMLFWGIATPIMLGTVILLRYGR